MKRFVLLCALALAGCGQAVSPSAPPTPIQTETVYDRFEKLQSTQAFQNATAEPLRRMSELSWLVGEWAATVTVFAHGATPESTEQGRTAFRLVGDSLIVSDDMTTVLTYDGFQQRWVTSGAEPPAAPHTYAVATGAWDGQKIVFEGEVTLLGERFWLRQTLSKLGDNEFELLNEQRTAPNTYVRLDRYHYTRIVRDRDPEDSRPG